MDLDLDQNRGINKSRRTSVDIQHTQFVFGKFKDMNSIESWPFIYPKCLYMELVITE